MVTAVRARRPPNHGPRTYRRKQMPNVKGKKYPYTPKGIAAAKVARKKLKKGGLVNKKKK